MFFFAKKNTFLILLVLNDYSVNFAQISPTGAVSNALSDSNHISDMFYNKQSNGVARAIKIVRAFTFELLVQSFPYVLSHLMTKEHT